MLQQCLFQLLLDQEDNASCDESSSLLSEENSDSLISSYLEQADQNPESLEI